VERQEKEGRKIKKINGRNLVSTGMERKKKRRKKNEKGYGVFELMLFWYANINSPTTNI
jgi:hypothetical protein